MDPLNWEILSLLQADGRMSMTSLASRIGLSLSSCHRRVKDLEASGVIERYRAVVCAERVGLGFEALVFVTMGLTDLDTVTRFESAVDEIPQVLTAERLFGEPDFILRVLTRDLASYQALYDTTLSSLPGVQRLTSTMVMKHLSADGSIPVPH